jgi:hypothetical protein
MIGTPGKINTAVELKLLKGTRCSDTVGCPLNVGYYINDALHKIESVS